VFFFFFEKLPRQSFMTQHALGFRAQQSVKQHRQHNTASTKREVDSIKEG